MDGIVNGVHDEGDGCRHVEAKLNTCMHQAKEVIKGVHSGERAAGRAGVSAGGLEQEQQLLCMGLNDVLPQIALRARDKAAAGLQKGQMQQHWATRVHLQDFAAGCSWVQACSTRLSIPTVHTQAAANAIQTIATHAKPECHCKSQPSCCGSDSGLAL